MAHMLFCNPASFLAFFCLSINSARATLIIVLYDDSNVYIAADSRIEKNGKHLDNICKIKQSGPWFLARAGLFETEPCGESIQDRILKADTTGCSLPDALAPLTATIAYEFTSLLRTNKSSFPDAYSRILSRGTEISVVLLCGFREGKRVTELTIWKLRFDDNSIPYVTPEKEVLQLPASDYWGFQIMGQNHAIAKASESNPEFFDRRRDPLTLLRDCFRLQLDSLPATDPAQGVGGSIDILHITPEKAEWIQRKVECEEIVQFWSHPSTNGDAKSPQPKSPDVRTR
jgi:hypothetical protein